MIRPFADYVIVEVRPRNMSKGGLHLPQTAQEDFDFEGTVVAVGPGKLNGEGERMPVSAEVGMKVIFGRRVGWEVEYEGKKLLAIHDTDIIAGTEGDEV